LVQLLYTYSSHADPLSNIDRSIAAAFCEEIDGMRFVVGSQQQQKKGGLGFFPLYLYLYLYHVNHYFTEIFQCFKFSFLSRWYMPLNKTLMITLTAHLHFFTSMIHLHSWRTAKSGLLGVGQPAFLSEPKFGPCFIFSSSINLFPLFQLARPKFCWISKFDFIWNFLFLRLKTFLVFVVWKLYFNELPH
jgi:hypothetical protein